MLAVLMAALLLEAAVAQRCLSSEAYFISDGRDYRGAVNVSASGAACLHWADQHDLQVPNPSLGLLPGDNSCRNPFGLAAPFCFTGNIDAPYQLCSVGPPCPLVQPQPSLLFVPSAPSIPAGTFVAIACFPQPCQVYFTLDGAAPVAGVSPAYLHGFAVAASTTVSAVGVLLDGTELTASQYFTVIAPPPVPAVFFPDPLAVYVAPVFVTLRAFPPGVSVDIFVDGSSAGFPYTGPFWLAASSSVVAVFNRSQTLVAAYTILAPTPTQPNVFPASGGVYIGGVRVLIYRPQGAALLEAAVNGSAWVPLAEPAYVISAVGLTTLAVRATFLGGLQSATSLGNYTVFPSLPPACVPPSTAVFVTPTNVTCSDPVGKPLQLRLNSMLLPQSTWLLSLPGTYTIGASYTDDGGFDRSIALQYVLAAVPLPTPTIAPCAGMFLGPLVVSVAVGAPATPNWQLVTGGALIGTGPVFHVTGDGMVQLTAGLRSFDPMFLDSAVASCSLGIATSGGSASTAPLRVRNPLPSLMASLGQCLLLAVPALYVRVAPPVGPYVLVSIANVSDWFAAVYDAKLERCLALTQPQPSARAYALATGYVPLFDAAPVGSTNQVQMLGTGLTGATFRAVRAEYDCDDIGVPVGNCSDQMVCSVSLLFVGLYSICADCGDGFYKVPGGTLLNITSSAAAMLPPTVTPCGGPVGSGVVVSLDRSPGVTYSVNGSQWRPAPPTLYVTAPSVLAVRSAQGMQAACAFYAATAATKFTAYSLAFDTASGLRIGLTGSAALDAAVAVQVTRSATHPPRSAFCNDSSPLFVAYVTRGLAGWVSDGTVSLPLPSADATALTVCVLGAPMAPSNVILSPLALSTLPCSASPTGCFAGIPTCVTNMHLVLCGPVPPGPPTDYSMLLKLLLLAAYACVVAIIFVMWRFSSEEHIPGAPISLKVEA